MSSRSALLSLAAAALLAGCANDGSVGPVTLPGSGAQADRASPNFAPGGEKTLYLSIVDGLIKQNRQGAALAFLDSYRQSGETLSPRYWLLRGNALWGVHRDSEAAELAPAIRANVVCPGAVETPMTAGTLRDPSGAVIAAIVDRYALGRPASPDEIAAGILFLTSHESSFVTGISLPVDGGRTYH